MKKSLLIFFLISNFSIHQLFTQNIFQDTLPDNHILFVLPILDDRLEGANEHLEGFNISMDFPHQLEKRKLDENNLISLVRNNKITGTLTYPNGEKTQIRYEVVNHRKTEDIYMKTTLGYFLWENVTIQDDKVIFVINWWYCPPARKIDLETCEMVIQILSDSINWHKDDDRKCEDDIERNKWSLFCALKYASKKKMGEYNHHNTVMQTVRFVIDELIPDHEFEHTLMDYNNLQSTKHKDIIHVLEIARKRIEQEIERSEN